RRNKFLLKAGDTAFNFYLPDEEGAYYNLSDFRGRLVLLNFWFPGCLPCVFEIPYERALHKRFENRDFMLINICLNRTRETVWKAALKRYNMSGLNLWANENWSGILGRNYDVTSFPRYVLIGEDGKIIDPYAKKPSTGLMSEIEKLLDPSAD
ncbi:MAG TPA: TlpA family protein disulfide reductase, partial [Caldithrix abyssi]|nr:TlpA family protein disulfide reductase [Caldithrix abyssi]